jgi:hypothetical protein
MTPDFASLHPGYATHISGYGSGVRRNDIAILICPTGCFAIFLSTPVSKNIPLPVLVDAALLIPPSHPTEGRIAIVTDAGRDVMDAGGAADESAGSADGEVVWS